jgi:predicted dinucleotide-binding enzyme
VVKAFNHLPAKLLAESPHALSGRRVLFFAGTDGPAKAEVAALIDKIGFFGVDLGLLTEGDRAINVPGGTLTMQNLIRLD